MNPQIWHRRNRSSPSDPDVQKKVFSSVSSGRTRRCTVATANCRQAARKELGLHQRVDPVHHIRSSWVVGAAIVPLQPSSNIEELPEMVAQSDLGLDRARRYLLSR